MVAYPLGTITELVKVKLLYFKKKLLQISTSTGFTHTKKRKKVILYLISVIHFELSESITSFAKDKKVFKLVKVYLTESLFLLHYAIVNQY